MRMILADIPSTSAGYRVRMGTLAVRVRAAQGNAMRVCPARIGVPRDSVRVRPRLCGAGQADAVYMSALSSRRPTD